VGTQSRLAPDGVTLIPPLSGPTSRSSPSSACALTRGQPERSPRSQ
jgi:hypothetical protein